MMVNSDNVTIPNYNMFKFDLGIIDIGILAFLYLVLSR